MGAPERERERRWEARKLALEKAMATTPTVGRTPAKVTAQAQEFYDWLVA